MNTNDTRIHIPMNEDIRAKWVAELRSGKHTQVRGRLEMLDNDGAAVVGRCCLGVLCRLAIDNGLKVHTSIGFVAGPPRAFTTFDGEPSVLPDSVLLWAGMPDNNPDVYFCQPISALNDEGFTFTELADIIEGKWTEGQVRKRVNELRMEETGQV